MFFGISLLLVAAGDGFRFCDVRVLAGIAELAGGEMDSVAAPVVFGLAGM